MKCSECAAVLPHDSRVDRLTCGTACRNRRFKRLRREALRDVLTRAARGEDVRLPAGRLLELLKLT